jgi:hypothetical protein
MTTEPDIQEIYGIIKEILVWENKIGSGVNFVRIVSLANNKSN